MPNKPRKKTRRGKKKINEDISNKQNITNKHVENVNMEALEKLMRKNYYLHKKIYIGHNKKPILDEPILEKIYSLLKENVAQLIGIKQINNEIILASNCVFDKKYNDDNYRDYFVYLNIFQPPPYLENVMYFKILKNDDIVLKTTDKSQIFKFENNESPEEKFRKLIKLSNIDTQSSITELINNFDSDDEDDDSNCILDLSIDEFLSSLN